MQNAKKDEKDDAAEFKDEMEATATNKNISLQEKVDGLNVLMAKFLRTHNPKKFNN